MSKFAWVTLTTNDTYSLGALVLANSLKRAHTAHQLAVLVTPGVSDAMRSKLKDAFNVVQEVDILDSKDSANLALLARPELGITFTKLHCWRLVQFEKCVFLDADTVVLKNCDELFEREEFSAAPDVSWPDCFNSGVFVFRPSVDTFGKITDFAVKHGSFDGGDQGLLNLFFSDWAHKDISKHLPFTYNTAALASYCYLPAFKQFRDQIKIVHFCGKLKPWFVPFNTQSQKAEVPSDYTHATDIIQMWWTIFCESVHDKLSDQMNDFFGTHGAPDVQEVISSVPIFHDPWEDYYLRQKQIEEEEKQKKLELQRLREEEDKRRKLREAEARKQFEEELERTRLEMEELEVKRREVQETIYQQKRHEEERQIWEDAQRKEREEAEERIKRQQEEQERRLREERQREPEKETKEEQVQESEVIVQNPIPIDESIPEVGLAGALSSLKLGERDRTPEQEAYEHLMRRQLWETGNIDYCGKDSFDNIMKRITKTLEEKPTKPEVEGEGEEATKKSDDGSTN